MVLALTVQFVILSLFWLFFASSIKSAAEFRSWRWNYEDNSRLSGYVMETKVGLTILSCLSLCGTVSGCRTVNHALENGRCELNRGDDRWENVAAPITDWKFRYYRRKIPRSPQDIDRAHIDETCHEDHLPLDGTCLQIVPNDALLFEDAWKACNQKYGRLAVLDTPVLEGVLEYLKSNESDGAYYIDIIRADNGGLVWGATGKNVTSTQPPWENGQPDNYQSGSSPENCGAIEKSYDVKSQFRGFRFNDVPCDLIDYGYICQYTL